MGRISKEEFVFKALMRGHTVHLQGYDYRLFSPGETVRTAQGDQVADQYWLGMEMSMTRGDIKSLIYVGSHFMFSQMLNTFSEITDQELTRIKKLVKGI